MTPTRYNRSLLKGLDVWKVLVDPALRLLATCLPILYALACAAYALVFFRKDPGARRLASPLLYGAATLHVVFLTLLTQELRRVPIATTFELFSVLALALAIVYLVQEHRSGTPYTGVLFVPLMFLCQTIASAFVSPVVEIQRPLLQSPLFGLHIAAVLLGYSAFAVSAIYGLLFLLLYKELRAHRFGLIYERLPPLEVLSGMNLRAAVFGLACLTVAIAAGALMSVRAFPDFWHDPKVLTSLGVWLLYASCLFVRYVGNWRGTRIAYFTIAGFLLLVFSMLAINRLFPSFHDFRV